MCESILRAISKATKHQSDTECSVRGEWFTGLEGVSTRPWKANSKAKLSIPSISQLSALPGVSRSNPCSFAPVKERPSKATEQDLPPTTTAAGVRSEGEESISKDRIFTCPEDGCVPTFLRYSLMRRHTRAVERDTLFDKAAVGYAQTWRTMSSPFSTHVLNNHPPWPTRYHRVGSPSKRARFTDKQRKFKVEKGERSQRKIGPASADCCWLEEKSNFQ